MTTIETPVANKIDTLFYKLSTENREMLQKIKNFDFLKNKMVIIGKGPQRSVYIIRHNSVFESLQGKTDIHLSLTEQGFLDHAKEGLIENNEANGLLLAELITKINRQVFPAYRLDVYQRKT